MSDSLERQLADARKALEAAAKHRDKWRSRWEENQRELEDLKGKQHRIRRSLGVEDDEADACEAIRAFIATQDQRVKMALQQMESQKARVVLLREELDGLKASGGRELGTGGLLSDAEARRFTAYLDRVASDARTMNKNLESMGIASPLLESMQDRSKMTIASCMVLMQHMNSGEKMTIGKSDIA
jgi:chromosome segregation ATPase